MENTQLLRYRIFIRFHIVSFDFWFVIYYCGLFDWVSDP
jgi:hypothetical protein